ERRGYGSPVGRKDPRTRNWRKPQLHVGRFGEIAQDVTLRDMAGNGCKLHRANYRQALVARRAYSFKSLECQAQVVAHSAVENCKRAVAGLRNERISSAANP